MKEKEDYSEIIKRLKELPLQQVDNGLEERFKKMQSGLTEEENRTSNKVKSLWKQPLPWVAAAAVVALLFWLSPSTDLESNYTALTENSDKLNFLNELVENDLKGEEIQWLQGLLVEEEQPNVKIMLLDLLEIHELRPREKSIELLEKESVPAVQM
ncbi:MAG: hypothetical protein HKN48_10190, partial [Flavobacteriaceae bacterium]|nr:hypothetical protein [Flavobacteriaceae bacterium]